MADMILVPIDYGVHVFFKPLSQVRLVLFLIHSVLLRVYSCVMCAHSTPQIVSSEKWEPLPCGFFLFDLSKHIPEYPMCPILSIYGIYIYKNHQKPIYKGLCLGCSYSMVYRRISGVWIIACIDWYLARECHRISKIVSGETWWTIMNWIPMFVCTMIYNFTSMTQYELCINLH